MDFSACIDFGFSNESNNASETLITDQSCEIMKILENFYFLKKFEIRFVNERYSL